jgi:hypothetical protein
MDLDRLKQFIKDSRLCSSTEKCAVACATDNPEIAPWCENLSEAWSNLDLDQQCTVNKYREILGLVPFALNRI